MPPEVGSNGSECDVTQGRARGNEEEKKGDDDEQERITHSFAKTLQQGWTEPILTGAHDDNTLHTKWNSAPLPPSPPLVKSTTMTKTTTSKTSTTLTRIYHCHMLPIKSYPPA